MVTPRNELKFFISSDSAILLEKRLSAVLSKDSHTEKCGSYQIRSLYFDDPTSSSFLDKVNGLEKRAKYRLRFYNDCLEYIRLEKKEKIGNKSFKTLLPVSLSFAQGIIENQPSFPEATDPLANEMLFKLRYERFRPLLFVDYRRKAFLHPLGNVRITLDDSLSATRFRESLLDRSGSIPVLLPHETVLEVKFDSFFPPFISSLIEDIPKVNCAISKFCRCHEMIF